ncbi:MAG: DUF4160 domain-containing protein [Bacteriovoracaceae bacterium]|nr:DUF4160 domain-containing protein [Bacteriovoracaceae bacterium]
MPCISSFYGIRIYLYPNDHNPPHFHIKYYEFNAKKKSYWKVLNSW